MSRRVVFLFGAGAALSWNSPKTSELTKLIRESGFKTTDNKTYITEFIFQTLITNGYPEADINFETIINVIEELMVYYSPFNALMNTPSLMRCFSSPYFEDEIFNFSIKGGVIKHGYMLEIPKGTEYSFSRLAYHQESPKQFFLQHLLAELLTTINARISKYAYHTTGNSVIQKDGYESTLFVNWMQSFSDCSLRLYTLNYDRLFKILLEHNGIQVFEGFDSGEYIGPSVWLRADVPKILADSNINVHYNLHGSSFWQTEAHDKDQLPNPAFFLTGAPSLAVNGDHAIVQIEKGKTVMLSNIVTGYQKAQRAMITPLKQMQAAFDKDCCFADQIYIIGYSLGDEHINETIKTAIRHNNNVKIIIVDPFFLINELDFQLAIKLFPYRQSGSMHPQTLQENIHSFFDGAFILYTLGFKEFLELQTGSYSFHQDRSPLK